MLGIDTKIKRGSGELAILALLNREPLHGYEISKRIAELTGGVLQFNLASLYPLLYRMEKRGWVKGNWEEAKNGRKRRYYRLTPAGKKQLVPLRKEWGLFFRALHRIAGVADAG
jgi:transcriptional regulator